MSDHTDSEDASKHALSFFLLGLTLGAAGAYLAGTPEGRRLSLDFIHSLPQSNFKDKLLLYYDNLVKELSKPPSARPLADKSPPPFPGQDFPPPPASIPENLKSLESSGY